MPRRQQPNRRRSRFQESLHNGGGVDRRHRRIAPAAYGRSADPGPVAERGWSPPRACTRDRRGFAGQNSTQGRSASSFASSRLRVSSFVDAAPPTTESSAKQIPRVSSHNGGLPALRPRESGVRLPASRRGKRLGLSVRNVVLLNHRTPSALAARPRIALTIPHRATRGRHGFDGGRDATVACMGSWVPFKTPGLLNCRRIIRTGCLIAVTLPRSAPVGSDEATQIRISDGVCSSAIDENVTPP